MIQYSGLKLMDVYNEIMVHISSLRLPINIDFSTILNHINKSVREVMSYTLPFKDYMYTSNITLGSITPLPLSFIKEIRVMAKQGEDPAYREARRVSAKEVYSINYNNFGHDWNRSRNISPTYTIWAGSVYMFPSKANGSATDTTGYMECYLLPSDNYNVLSLSSILPVPYEFEELVRLTTLARVLSDYNFQTQAMDIMQKVQLEKKKAMELYQAKKSTEQRSLANFVEPLQPFVPPQPIEGEAPTRMA